MPPWVHVLACPACSFATLVVNSLNDHIAGCHGGQEVSYILYVCPACDACSTDSRLIDEHLLVYHCEADDSQGDCELQQLQAAQQQLGSSLRAPAGGRVPVKGSALASAGTPAAATVVVEAHVCPACRLIFASLAALRQHRCQAGRGTPATGGSGEDEEADDPLMRRLLRIWSPGNAEAELNEEAEAAGAAIAVDIADEDETNEPGASQQPVMSLTEDAEAETDEGAVRQCPATLRCPSCPARARTLGTLSGHQLRQHGSIRCPVCDAVEFSVDAAVGHIAADHAGEPVYRCPRCPAAFDRHDRLLVHWAAEHCRKVFKCPFCSRNFLQERYRTRHVRQLHPAQVARIQPCPQCPQVLGSADDLRRHLRDSHGAPADGSRLRCGVCGRTFALAKSLRLHELSHRPQPAPFACGLCPYTCNTRYLLQCHVRDKHTNFTYNCSLCQARLLSRYLLRKHMNATHGLADAAAAVRAAASLKRQGLGLGAGGGVSGRS